jgi:DNA-binding FrmR family transcriptional regulator
MQKQAKAPSAHGSSASTHRSSAQKAAVHKRLSRIEGQVRGLSRMVEEDRYCIDIVTQIAAVRAALRRVEEEVLRDHVAHCVHGAIASGDRAEQRRKIEELMQVLVRAER